MQGWTLHPCQERLLLSLVSLQPWGAYGAGEADHQEGQGVSENVLGYGKACDPKTL